MIKLEAAGKKRWFLNRNWNLEARLRRKYKTVSSNVT